MEWNERLLIWSAGVWTWWLELRDGEGVTSLADEVTTFLRNYFHYFLNLAVTPWNGVAWELLRCATESLFYSLPVF